MNLTLNAVYEARATGADWLPTPCRFLGSDSLGRAVLIPVAGQRGAFTVASGKVEAALEGNVIAEFKTSFPRLHRNPNDLSAVAKSMIQERSVILKALQETGGCALSRDTRAEIYARIGTEAGCSARTVRRIHDRFLKAGQTELATMPDLDRCGAPGKPKRDGARRGPRRGPDLDPSRPEYPEWLGLTPETYEPAAVHVKKHYRPGKTSIRSCYTKFLQSVLPEAGEIVGSTLVRKLDLSCPALSIWQYRRICIQLNADGGLKRLAVGKDKFRKAHGIHPIRTHDGVEAPGERYLLDWTGLQVPLRSSLNRNEPIGNAILYSVVDLWSTAIIAAYVELARTPTMASARRALLMAMSDKRPYFKRSGIAITDDENLIGLLPNDLLVDRGEFRADSSDLIPKYLSSKLSFARTRRGDDKPQVERMFRTMKYGPFIGLPGAYRKSESFREEDRRHEGTLTLSELRRIVYDAWIEENKRPVPKEYVPPEMLEAGDSDISREALFRWGCANRVGHGITMEHGLLFRHLLAEATAIVHRDGIHFLGSRFYGSEIQDLLKRAAYSGSYDIEIRHDPMNAGEIWIAHADPSQWVCIPNTSQTFLDTQASFVEMQAYSKAAGKAGRATDMATAARRAGLTEDRELAVKEAKQSSRQVDDHRGRTARKATNQQLRQLENAMDVLGENVEYVEARLAKLDREASAPPAQGLEKDPFKARRAALAAKLMQNDSRLETENG